MDQNCIFIKGARENNLKDVTLFVPKRKLTVFTGVSGSGKSSLVFDTIGAEAQRELNETFSAFIRNRLPKFSKPEAEAIENLSPAIVVDQKRLGGNSRSTVGTITDTYTLLRLLFSRVGQPFIGYSNAFSFNDPSGMCPECHGVGKIVTADPGKLLDREKSLNEGGITFPTFRVGTWYWKLYVMSGLFDNDKKLGDYSEEEWNLLLYGIRGKEAKITFDTTSGPMEASYEGVITKFERLYIKRDSEEIAEATLSRAQPYMSCNPCPLCRGTRLNQEALGCRIGSLNIAEMAAMEIRELLRVVHGIQEPAAVTVTSALTERLQQLIDIGLDYLSLDRETASLSGGESQRVKMVRHLGSSLTDILYIFDEPSAGLHPRDVIRLNRLLRRLCDKGNTVLVVEHDRDVITSADHIVDVGPRAGVNGGRIVYEGDVEGLLRADTQTGRHMRHEVPLRKDVRKPTGIYPIVDATLHNLKRVSVDIPAGVLTVVTGVAGSGKSSLINGEFLARYPEAIATDQSAVGASVRSNPATYTGIMDELRKLFARVNTVSASLFSFNSSGACQTCQGLGVLYTDLAFMEGIRTVCETCGGRRFKEEVLRYRYQDRSISDVLELTTEEALAIFDKQPAIRRRLQAVSDVGLGYVTLGQPLSTLSGGERQRLKLACELHKAGSIYVMDEPTTGLHISDVGLMIDILNRLVDAGNTVIVIEHHPDIIRSADWIIDMGPESGTRGGTVMFQGTPRQLIEGQGDAARSITGSYLRGELR
ncbi:ATP-binding cassette domain-containing protein [Paenibacillus sp. OAS669]|uniref:ATP-binding cassette domain-containing protein n=1 Tax=Paenibacillus sp. OAS669 TaxID=2663821 RepID=UPI00178AF0CB|nr:excinuclease ABC subunit UvrA [Paenibacillus sp. OAS669]MBE1445844.1 excinuclease UvrABC ATPase subunit [Paenibacillus sp. OAS669]